MAIQLNKIKGKSYKSVHIRETLRTLAAADSRIKEYVYGPISRLTNAQNSKISYPVMYVRPINSALARDNKEYFYVTFMILFSVPTDNFQLQDDASVLAESILCDVVALLNNKPIKQEVGGIEYEYLLFDSKLCFELMSRSEVCGYTADNLWGWEARYKIPLPQPSSLACDPERLDKMNFKSSTISSSFSWNYDGEKVTLTDLSTGNDPSCNEWIVTEETRTNKQDKYAGASVCLENLRANCPISVRLCTRKDKDSPPCYSRALLHLCKGVPDCGECWPDNDIGVNPGAVKYDKKGITKRKY